VEIACLERLFDSVEPAEMIACDDYGWKPYHRQEDGCFAERGHWVLGLPAGQGLAKR
jgi:hypothetical protein